jgi:hypothetical protein
MKEMNEHHIAQLAYRWPWLFLHGIRCVRKSACQSSGRTAESIRSRTKRRLTNYYFIQLNQPKNPEATSGFFIPQVLIIMKSKGSFEQNELVATA